MDAETSEIIALLCTKIGTIMEDASVVALTINGLDDDKRSTAIEELEAAGDRIRALAAAARVLSA